MAAWVLADIVAFTALAVGVSAFALAAVMAKRIGTRDPMSVPAMWRKVLRIKPYPLGLEDDVLPLRQGNERIAFIANPTKAGGSRAGPQGVRNPLPAPTAVASHLGGRCGSGGGPQGD